MKIKPGHTGKPHLHTKEIARRLRQAARIAERQS